jgi:thiamine biosynthesis lipoprotein
MKRLIACLLVCALLCGCSADMPVTKQRFAMDTLMDFTIWGKQSIDYFNSLSDLISLLESQWSVMKEDSIISKLNRGENVELDAEQQALLDKAEALSKRTGGAFDPKLYSVSAAWGFFDGDGRVPTEAQIAQALAEKKWDLGAVVKGYAGQECVRMLQELGCHRALLNLGGNIQTFGSKADGSPWRIGIQDPDNSTGNLGILEVEGTMSIVTSGDYQRYFTADGKDYHHIMDPQTGRPADSGLRSVTVLCRDGMTADALSTALFVMGLEEATMFWRNSSDFEAVFLTLDGKLYATEGAGLTDCVFEVISREN